MEQQTQHRSRPLRRLLNTEKLIFTTDDGGIPLTLRASPGSGRPKIVVSAETEGVAYDPTKRTHAKYNIILDPLVMGVPNTALRIIPLGIGILVFIIYIGVPCFLREAEKIVEETTDEEKDSDDEEKHGTVWKPTRDGKGQRRTSARLVSRGTAT